MMNRFARRASRRRARASTQLAATAAVAALLLSACGGGEEAADDEGGQAEQITFWTPHASPERLDAQEAIAARFTESTGIAVEVVPLDRDDQNTTLIAGAASGDVPDVILHNADQGPAWYEQGLLDADAAEAVIDDLGRDTFAENAFSLATVDDRTLSVPMDGWGHLLVYRTDLFEAAGLPHPPESVEDVAEAATVLAETGVIGIGLGTQVGHPFTRETLEAMLLANDCQLVDDEGVAMNSEKCVRGLELYQQMAASTGPGELDVEGARAAYLAGDAAMIVFSSHFLDEMANLDSNNPVTCDECADNPRFLVENSGIVTGLTGPDNPDTAQYGATHNLGIPVGAQTEAAQQYVDFLLNDGYLDSLQTAAEGRVPLRLGTQEEPTKFADAWADLPFGTEATGESITDVYGAETAEQIVAAGNVYTRWGAGTDNYLLASAINTRNTVPQNLGNLFTGGDPAAIAEQLQEAAVGVQQDMQ